VIGAAGDNTVLAVLRLGFGVPELWAKAAGIETAIVLMFILNEYWTFADAGPSGVKAFVSRLAKSHLVRSGGVTVQLIVYWLLTQYLTVTLVLGDTDLWFLAASPIAIGIAMFVNYVFETLFTWQAHREHEKN
jgi:putative flippase GtrA